MFVCQDLAGLRAEIMAWRMAGERIAFVPTMGNLHDGHLSLVTSARQHASRVVVSIYVNPLQFSPDEDFESYPRTLEQDLEKLQAMGVDLVFTPDSQLIYPQGEKQNCFVEVPGLSHIIEGEFRPGFFRGVATVVLKLFNMVQPDIAVFGEKDYQQLLVIKQMVKDLNLPIDIIGAEIVREPDGLAMSSRNNYLGPEDRAGSRQLCETLRACRDRIKQGAGLEQASADAEKMLTEHGFAVDYVTVRETGTLAKVTDKTPSNGTLQREIIILAAAKIGKTRLIDNLKFVY
jgi:pantoate--beta-alanine ligase